MKNLTNKQFLARLRKLNACNLAVEWVKQHGGSAADCWRDCDNGSWMGWLIGYMKLYESPQKLALCLADIIKPCSKLLPEAKVVEKTLRLYATGKATIEEVNAAAGAAEAAEAAVWAAGRAAGRAAGWAAEAAGWADDLKRSANIFRKHYPAPFGKVSQA